MLPGFRLGFSMAADTQPDGNTPTDLTWGPPDGTLGPMCTPLPRSLAVLAVLLAAGSLAVTSTLAHAQPGSAAAGCADKPEVRFYHWAWNAQMGLILANGGKQAAA